MTINRSSFAFGAGCALFVIGLFIATMAFAGTGPDPDKSGSGRDGGPSSSRSERASSAPAGMPIGPACDAACEQALEENDARANNPDYEPNPDDPDSCSGGCVVPDNIDTDEPGMGGIDIPDE